MRNSLLLVALAVLTNTLQAQPAPIPPGHATLTPAQMHADIAAFRSDFFDRDKSYSQLARSIADKQLADLEQKVDGATPAQFELGLAFIVALADNGHTIDAPNVRARHFDHVPIYLTPFGTDFRVLRAAGTATELLGAKLVAIDGHPMRQLLESARMLVGGEARWRDRFANVLFESPQQLNALHLASDSGRAAYVFELPNGRTVTRTLAAEADAALDPRMGPRRALAPELLPSEQGKWSALLPASKAPWSLAEPDVPFRMRSAPELGGIVVQLRQVNDAPGHPISDFLSEVKSRIQAEHPRNLVIDMRFNGGGNLQTTRDFMKSLPGLVPGRIFALTSPWTFSAAISSVGYLKQAAPSKVTIVGDTVGDRLVFFAEGRPTTLPNSGAVIAFATQRHDYQNGCRTFSDCHPPVVQFPIAVPSLAPEILAPWTFEAYRDGRDPAIEAIVKALGR